MKKNIFSNNKKSEGVVEQLKHHHEHSLVACRNISLVNQDKYII